MLTKLLWNYAACERHLFNRSAPYSGGSRPSDKGGRSPKRFFSALRASVWSKNKAPPPGTSPGSATAIERGVFAIAMIYHIGNYSAKNFRSDLTALYGCLLPRKDVFNIITIVWINADFNIEINCCEPRLVSVSKRCM